MEYQLKQNAEACDLMVRLIEGMVRGEVASWFADNCFLTISLFDRWVLHSLFLLLWKHPSWIESLPCDLINLTLPSEVLSPNTITMV